MIWNSVFLMTLIDFLIILAVLYSAAIFFKHYRAAKQLGLTVGVNFILSGLALIGLFYLIDLSTMHIYPLFTTQAFAMTSMTNLHLNWSWIGILISVGAIAIGLSYLVRVLIPKTSHTLENLKLTKDSLKEELAVRHRAEATMRESLENLEWHVEERTAELESVNAKLQQEIVERTETEQALRDSEEKYRLLAENVDDVLWVRSAALDRYTYISPAITRLLGYRPEEMLTKPLSDFIAPTSYPYVRQEIEQRLADEAAGTGDDSPRTFEVEWVCKDGSTVWIESRTRPLRDEAGQFQGFIGVTRDITERKQAEQALRESEARYQILFDSMLDGYALHEIICDDDGNPIDYRFIDINLAFENFTGLSRDIIGKTVRQVLPTVEQHWIDTYGKVALTGKSARFENYSEGIGGRWFEVAAFSPAEKQFVAVFHDRTERKQAEEALRESEERYRAVVQDQTELICRTWPDGTFSFVNEAYCCYYGKQREDLIGSRLEPSPLLDEDRDMVQKYYAAFGPEKPLGTIEHRVRLPNGEIRWQQWTDRTLLDEQGRVVEHQSVGRDITERKQAQQALARRAQEMGALYETSLEINSHQDVSVLLQAIVQRAAGLLETQMGGLLLMQLDGETLELAVGHNQPDEYIGSRLRLGEGVAGRVAQTSEPLQVANYRDWEEQVDHMGYASIGRILGVPLKQRGQIIGVLNVFDKEEGSFDEDEVRLLSLFAVQAVIAIENARLIAQTRLGRERLKILHEIDQAILASQSPEEIAEAALGHIRRLVLCQRASVSLFNFEAGEAIILAVHGNGNTDLGPRKRLPLDSFGNIPELQQGQHRLIEDVMALVKLSGTDEQLLAEGVRTYVNIPLISRDEVIGSLNLGAMEPGTFDLEHVEIAHQIADQLAIAIQQAQLREAETQRRREAETLREATGALTSALELDQVLDAILTHLEAVVPYDSAGVFLRENGHLQAVAGRGFPDLEQVQGQRYPLDDDVFFDEIQRTARPVILADAQTDSRFVHWADTDYIRGWMGVPLLVSGEVIGFLTLDSRQAAAYGEAEAAVTQAFANQAAVAIENARLFEAEQRQREIAETLGEVAKAVNSSLNLTAVLDRVLLELEKVIEYDSASIRFLEQDTLRLAAGRRFGGQQVDMAPSVSLTELPLVQKVIHQREPMLIPDTRQESLFNPNMRSSTLIRCLISIPLISREDVIGLLTVSSWTPHRYSAQDVDVAFQFAQQATIAIENARLYTETEQRAEHLAVLHELDQAITSSLHINDVYPAFAQQTLRLLPYDNMLIMLLKEDELQITFTAGEVIMHPVGTILPLRAMRVSGWVIANNQPLLTDDIAADMRFEVTPQAAASGMQSGMAIPLRVKGKIIGIWNLIHRQVGCYSSNDLVIAQSMADQLAIAIENARLYTESEQRAEHLAVLRELDQAITASLRTDDVYDAFAQQTRRLLLYDHMSIALLEGDNVHAAYTTGKELVVLAGTKQPIKETGMMSLAVGQGQPVLSGNIAADTRFVAYEQAIASGLKSAMIIPLHVKGQIIGAWNLARQQAEGYTDDDLTIAQSMADQLTIAIENARLFDQAQHYAKELEQRVADRTRELSALYDVTSVASESLDLQSALERSLEQVLEAMRTNMGIIRLLDEDRETLRLVAQQGFPPDNVAMVEAVSSSSGLVGQVIEHGEPLIVPDVTIDPRADRASFVAPQTAYVGVPIRARGRVLGTLSILKDKDQPEFSMEEVTLLSSIADHVGVVVESARLRQLASQAAVLEERGRLARDLHDSITQLLYSLNLFAEVGRESRRTGDIDQVDNSLKEIGEIAQQALKEMRLLVYELRPATLEQEGLVGALQHRLDAVEGRTGVKARLLLNEVVELEKHVEEALYRITQEALNNALKHAAATSVTVRLAIDKQQIALEVTDNGSGFDPDVINGGGLGLISMRERAEGLGGTLTITSAPGEGTSVEVRVKNEGVEKT